MKKILLLTACLTVLIALPAQQKDSVIAIGSITLKGNKKTKPFIILRELTFKTGDTVHNWSYHKEQSRKQLINLFIFNEIDIQLLDSGKVIVNVTERWYLWPAPVLQIADRNFNQWWLTRDPARLIYGVQLQWYNIRGRNETMLLDFKTGYTQLFNFIYRVPYFNKKNTWGVQFGTYVSANREVWYKTKEDKVQFFKYDNLFLINRRGAELVFTHRKKIFSYHLFYGGYRHINVKDTVITPAVNPDYLYAKGRTIQNEYYIGYQYTLDKRDFKGYPTRGYSFKAAIEGPYFASKGIQSMPILVKSTFAKYFKISNHFYASAGMTARYFKIDSQPYSRTSALGYGKDIIRGYELNVIDGNHFVLGKAELKYRLIHKKYNFLKGVPNYETLPLSVFLTTFYDAGYVWNNRKQTTLYNKMPNSLQYGTGLGLNFILFYDYCVRTEYSFNKYGQNRLFLNFITTF